MKFAKTSILLVSFASLVGCSTESMEQEEEEVAGETQDALATDNSLTTNSLTTNSLTTNSLTTNSLTTNSLTTNALAAIQDPGEVGTLNREFLQYTVACAFKSSQSFDFTWTDADNTVHAEHFVGQLALAPQWRTGPLGDHGKRMVSACLAAKTNYYGVHVTISVRSGEKPLRLNPNSDELDDFSKVEGAFWGNLWAPQPYLNACYNGTNVANSRSQFRDCAAGHVNSDGTTEECGIINIVGECKNVCKKYNASRGYYEDCREQPGVNHKRTDRVITTALP